MSNFHDKFYIGSMGMNTKVQGRLPLLQCIIFHSLLVFEEFVVRKIYLVKHHKSKTHISFKFTRIREGIGSTRRGILGTYTTNFRIKIYQLESRAVLTKQRIQFTRGIMYQGKIHKFNEYEGHCRIIIQPRIWRSIKDLM